MERSAIITAMSGAINPSFSRHFLYDGDIALAICLTLLGGTVGAQTLQLFRTFSGVHAILRYFVGDC